MHESSAQRRRRQRLPGEGRTASAVRPLPRLDPVRLPQLWCVEAHGGWASCGDVRSCAELNAITAAHKNLPDVHAHAHAGRGAGTRRVCKGRGRHWKALVRNNSIEAERELREIHGWGYDPAWP